MEAIEEVQDAPVSRETAEAQQPSKKRSLEDVQQGETEPNGPEPRQASSPEPEAKRVKTDQPDQDGAQSKHSAEEGKLEEDEDGEVSRPSDPASEEGGGGEGKGGQQVSQPTAPGEESDTGSKRTTRSMSAATKRPAQVGWNQGITSQIRTSLGAPTAAAAPAKTKLKEITPVPEPAPEPAPAPSKSTKPAEPAQTTKQTHKERRQEKQAQAAMDKQKAQEDQKKPFEYAPGLSFWLPNKKNLLQPKGNNLGTGVWKTKFKSWCQSFISRNIDQKDLLTADIVVAALQEYIATRAHWSKKKHGGVAAAEARKPSTKSDIAVNLATILKNDDFLSDMATGSGTKESPMVIDDKNDDDIQEVAPPSGETSAGAQATQSVGAEEVSPAEDPEHSQEDSLIDETDMEIARPGPPVMSEEDDLAQQRKYYPGLAESEQVCVFCASLGHTSASCPKTACKFCEQPSHFSWNCPTRERCTKCRQLGHGKAQCIEKLIHLDEEGAECATCGSQNHLESECEALWRSYKPPRRGMIRKVKTLPAFCSSCGAEGHYSSDCALRGDKPRSQTWALKNRDLYVDKDATDEPISDFASVPQKPQFNLQIKGSAAKRNHLFYPDSDGSEEGEFIGQRVKPRAPVGNIQMSTNIQFGNIGPPSQPQQNGRGQQRGGWSAQPPLPPGPPPPGPLVGSYSRMSKSYNNQSRAPPPSNGIGRGGLPPKPPTPHSQQHGFHSVAPPPNRPGPNAKKQRTRQPGNPPTGPAQHQNGGGPAGRRRGKNRRGGKQG